MFTGYCYQWKIVKHWAQSDRNCGPNVFNTRSCLYENKGLIKVIHYQQSSIFVQ